MEFVGYVILDKNGNQLKRFKHTTMDEVVHYIVIHNWETLSSEIKVIYKCKESGKEVFVNV